LKHEATNGQRLGWSPGDAAVGIADFFEEVETRNDEWLAQDPPGAGDGARGS
jgi:hypothetical protein